MRSQHAKGIIFELMAHLKIRPFSDTDLHQEEIRQAVYEEAPKNGFWYPAVSHAGQKLKNGHPSWHPERYLWK